MAGSGASAGAAGAGRGGADAGEGGEAGSEPGGEGGSSGSQDCQNDDDCDDQKFCTGAETCEDGECKAGEPFDCVNPDAEHCSARCEERTTDAECVVEALDFDQDGFTSAFCAADPGNDCNDDAAAINPDATETCDGLDNDCDDRVDTLDGLSLAGSTSDPIPGLYSLDMVWSPESEAFAVVFDRIPPAEGVFFATLLTNGVWVGGASPMFAPLASVDYFWPHLAWGGEAFGVSWTRYDSTNGFFVEITNVSVGGTPSTSRLTIAEVDNDIALRSDGEFVVISTNSKVLYASHFSTGSLHTGPQIATNVSLPHLATHGNGAAVVWHDNTADSVFFRRLDANLAPLGSQATALQEGGGFAEITSTADGYALAWIRRAGWLGFSRVRADGSLICSRSDVALGTAPDLSERVVVAETQYGTLALVTHNNGKVSLYRFGANCSVTAHLPVAEMPSSFAPSLAVGGGKVAIGWIANGTADGYTRVFGERLCE